ncbi:MAG: hypothetical protein IT317_21180 [Anaerolineales bacterium]|nr:hypothetical protein [Anaerolineales bacterium]
MSREPPINPAFAISEIVWLVSGRNDAAFLNYWNRQLPQYAGTAEHYHGSYDHRLRQHFGIDQLERAYWALQRQPNTRQVVLQIWNAAADLPDPDGAPADADIPCNVISILKVRHGRLEWLQVMRSNDLFLGTPYNFVQFTTLQELIAGWLGIEVGTYNHISDSLHPYADGLKSVATRADHRLESNLDKLELSFPESQLVFPRLGAAIKALASSALTEAQLVARAKEQTLPAALHDMFRVVAAEAARRRGWINAARAVMSLCTNPVLGQVWERWLARVAAGA